MSFQISELEFERDKFADVTEREGGGSNYFDGSSKAPTTGQIMRKARLMF